MKTKLLITFFALGGFVVGFSVRALKEARKGEYKVIAPIERERSSASLNLGSSFNRELAAQLATDLSLSPDVTRWLHWMTAVEKAELWDFPQLARLAKSLPGALPILATRWIEYDPRALFDACQRAGHGDADYPASDLMRQLLEEWPQKDPVGVMTMLLENKNLNSDWQYVAVSQLSKVEPEMALVAMHEIGIEGYVQELEGFATEDGVVTWAARNPSRAAEIVLSNPCGEAGEEVLKVIATEWAKQDAPGALTFATTQIGHLGSLLADTVLRRWVDRDREKASLWFTQADAKTREKLLPAFIGAWASNDPITALQWSLAHTEGHQQQVVVGSLIESFLEKNPAAAAAMVVDLEPSPTRTRAALVFAERMRQKDWWPGVSTDVGNASAKPEALEWLSQLDIDARQKVVGNIQYWWSHHDPRGFATYLRTPEGQAIASEFLSQAATALASKHPQEALEFASNAPAAQRQAILRDAFGTWSRTQPTAAMEWLRELPASDARRETFYEGALDELTPLSAFQGTSGADSLEPLREARKQLARDLATNPAAAQETLQRLNLSDTQRAKVAALLRLD